MNKLRKLLISGLAVCTIGCTAAGLAACTDAATTYPDYKRTQGTTAEFPNGEYFTVSVKSEGGQSVKGVQVSIVKDGEKITGISDDKGQVRFNAPRGSYQVIVDRDFLPAGYGVMENGDGFVTGSDANSATVMLSSSVITDKSPSSGMTYSSGDVLYDFAFTDTDGKKYTVSELLTDYGYNTIVLNWWYDGCTWCEAEFPIMQETYNSYDDKVAIICLSTRDSMAQVKDYREKNELTFFMCPDSSAGRQANYFNITGAPTTVFIDRYGVICAKHEGAIVEERTWIGLFENYSSDNYSQTIEQDNLGGDGSNAEWTKPSAAIQNSVDYGNITQTMNAVINADGNIVGDWHAATGENDKEIAWPFELKSENSEYYLTATNANVPVSYSIITTSVSLQAGDMLYVDYRLKNLLPDYDTFYVIVTGETEPGLATAKETNGWTTAKVYEAKRATTITVSFIYMSLFNSSTRNDEVSIKNLNIVNITDTDIDYPYDAATEPDANGNYTKFADVAKNPEDNLYHVYVTENGIRKDNGILFTAITQRSAWSERIYGHELVTVKGDGTVVPSLYNLAYWNMSNWEDFENNSNNFRLLFDFGMPNNSTLTDTLIETYYLDRYIADNNLVPVSDEIKDFLVAFVNRYNEMNGTTAHENEWLELCMYYQHYGKPHGSDSECLSFKNPIIGHNWANAIDMGEQTSIVVNMNKIRYNMNVEQYLTYTAKQTGIYRIYITNDNTNAGISLYLDGRQASSLDGSSCRGQTTSGSYIYVREGQTIGLNLISYNTEGRLTLNLQFTDQQSMDVYRTAANGGSWNSINQYSAISVILNPDDGVYYQLNRDGSYGSKIYIDFTQPTYYYERGVTLYNAIEARQFDLIDLGDDDYTDLMMEYYKKSIEGKSRGDADYGLAEATEELVNAIATYIQMRANEEALRSGYWLSMAYYQYHFGV